MYIYINKDANIPPGGIIRMGVCIRGGGPSKLGIPPEGGPMSCGIGGLSPGG